MSDTPALPSFEDAMKRLGEIVTALESGSLSLEDSLRLFEEGVALSRSAQIRLDGAEKRLEELLAVGADGTAKTRPLDTDD